MGFPKVTLGFDDSLEELREAVPVRGLGYWSEQTQTKIGRGKRQRGQDQGNQAQASGCPFLGKDNGSCLILPRM